MGNFNPNAYLNDFNADDYLAETEEPEVDMSVGDVALGAGNLLAAGGVGAVKEIAGGLGNLGGVLMGKSAGESVDASQAAVGQIPDVPLGEDAMNLVGALSESYQDLAPNFIKKIVSVVAQSPEIVGNEALADADAFEEATGIAIPPEAKAAYAAMWSSIPTVIETLSAAGIGKKAVKSGFDLAGDVADKGEDAIVESIKDVELTDMPTEEGMVGTGQTLKKGTPQQIAAEVSPDAEFYRASDELGISTEPLASFASKNPQFRAIEQGLASFPASQLDIQAKAYISDVAQSADDLITRYGGSLDKAELSSRFQDDMLRTIDDIYDSESKLYDAIDASLPGQTRVNPKNILSFIESKIAKSGGIKPFAKQNPRLMKMYGQLKPKSGGDPIIDPVMGAVSQKAINPTYEVMNDIRREVGQQLGRKGDTTFKNTETGLLKAIYGKLKDDQNSVVGTLDNGRELLKTTDAHTIQRKQLEDNLKTLLGKNLQKELMPVLGVAIKGLAPATGRVDTKKFRSTIEAIPEKFRGEAVVSALNDVFRGTSVNGQSLDATQFTKFMNQLNRSPESKALLYKNLPKGAAQSLENLYTVSKGISTAMGDRVTTGRISALFDEQDGMLKKLMKGGISMAATKVAGPLGGMGVSDLLANVSDAAKTTNALLASPSFQKTIRDAVRDGVVDGSAISDKIRRQESILAKTKQYKDWAATLPKEDAAKLSALGFVAYLNSSDEKEQGEE